LSRFDHLEMGDSLPSGMDGEPVHGEVDQHYFMEKANKAFEDGNYEPALKLFSRCLEYDINLDEAWAGQIRCLIELGEIQEAIIWAERAAERLPNSAQVLASRAVAELRYGRSTQAIGYADAAIGGVKVTQYVWVARGEVLIERNALNAKACFLKAAEMAASNPAVYSWIARAYLAHGCRHEALTYLRKVVKIDPDNFACWYWIGNCCEALGEIDDAEIAYHRAVSANPTFEKGRDAIYRLEAHGTLQKLGHSIRRMFGRG
jgi:tetratricopeptide (TPR) repeat protein